MYFVFIFHFFFSLQFLEQCDEVLYMKDGLISERGTHKELVIQGGDYRQMLQFDQIRDQKTTNDVDAEQTFDVEGGG
jgi:ABC-type transport system involved in cytochrome bd biosynthesis fused ATPase/permease subunit